MINHLDTAKHQARLLEQQEEEKAKEEYALYQDLGLPSGRFDTILCKGNIYLFIHLFDVGIYIKV